MELNDYRAAIDEVDSSLAELIERRMDIVADIAAYKESAGLPVFDMAREEAKLVSVAAKVKPEMADAVKEVFRLLMKLSRDAQYRRREEGDR